MWLKAAAPGLAIIYQRWIPDENCNLIEWDQPDYFPFENVEHTYDYSCPASLAGRGLLQ